MPILDEIDVWLTGLYRLIEEELDFVINMDIKCRMWNEFEWHK
jgi:hypothetical protein